MELSAKQQHILSVAETLFADKGYEGTSVRDIAQAAEINVAMVSYYFGSKEKLLQSLIQEHMESSSVMLDSLKKNKQMTSWEKIDFLIDFYVDKMLKNRKYHTILTRQISFDQRKELTELMVAIKHKNSAMIKDILKEGKQAGIFRNVNNTLTISTIIGTISQVSMSRPFYCDLLNIDLDDEEHYYKLITPKLKKHLKSLLHAHLSNPETSK